MAHADRRSRVPDGRTWLLRLAHAVLRDAIHLALERGHVSKRKARARDEAREWIAADDAVTPLSFLNCCFLLGLEPTAARRAIAARRAAPAIPYGPVLWTREQDPHRVHPPRP